MAAGNVKFQSETPDAKRDDDKAVTDAADLPQQERNDANRDERREDEETNNIVYRQQVTSPDGSVSEKVHGPMPVEEWADYERKNKL